MELARRRVAAEHPPGGLRPGKNLQRTKRHRLEFPRTRALKSRRNSARGLAPGRGKGALGQQPEGQRWKIPPPPRSGEVRAGESVQLRTARCGNPPSSWEPGAKRVVSIVCTENEAQGLKNTTFCRARLGTHTHSLFDGGQ
uniref:(northern house mosquito) hypothetical protein n=1 Tax=Culex pipiens TaxID=7175 RepID=A0A8D8G3H1_CULPI